MGDLRLPGDLLPARGRGEQRTSSPSTIAKAGARAGGTFAKAFPSTAASSSKRGKPAGKGQGKKKVKQVERSRETIVFRLKKSAQQMGNVGYAPRYDNDALFRLDMEAAGYPRILYCDNADPLDP